MSSIRMEHIVHSYGEHTVLKDFSMDIQDGEFISVIGGSGSGKTTVLKLINGLLIPDQGEIYVQDKAIRKVDQNELRRNIGYVIQSIGLFPHMTIEENIGYVLSLTKQDSALIQERVKEMMDIMKLEKQLLTRYPDELSGGQKQRVGIARALAVDPEFIVCDEPVSALDVSIQAQVVNMFEELQEQMGLTYLFIAHDLSIVKHISNRIGVMYLGNLVELADSYELTFHSVHPYTRSLISAIPIADPRTSRQSKRIVLSGDVPSPVNPPSGCRFRTRCPYADERCAAETPAWQEVSKGHYAACHHLDRVN